MGEFFKSLFDFLASGQVHFLKKLLTTLILVLVVFVIDNVTGFTYYYNLKNKTEQLEKLSTLIKDSTNPKTVSEQAKTELNLLLSRRNQFSSFLGSDLKSSDRQKNNTATESANKNETPMWFYLILILLSTGEFIILTIRSLRDFFKIKGSFPERIVYFLRNNILQILTILMLAYITIIYHNFSSTSTFKSIVFAIGINSFMIIILYSTYVYHKWADRVEKKTK